MARACCRYVTTVIYFLEKNDVSLMPLQSRSKCNLFYGREACNVKPPNMDVAILLGARVLANATATGDINGVAAAKRPCSFFRQSAGRPPHLPAPGIGVEPSRGVESSWSPLCSRQRPAAEFLYATKAQHRDKVRLHRWRDRKSRVNNNISDPNRVQKGTRVDNRIRILSEDIGGSTCFCVAPLTYNVWSEIKTEFGLRSRRIFCPFLACIKKEEANTILEKETLHPDTRNSGRTLERSAVSIPGTKPISGITLVRAI
ncbi:hypothetical protein TcG_07537 [Trypanosoma cruzi]|nr:hypothetical protein TcG_07537 [Trypanosoma cruzi]